MDSTTSKTGIVVYSRSGHSNRIATKLAEALAGTIIKLSAPRYDGAFGYMRAGFDSLRQTCTLPPQTFLSLSDFDRVIICGPVWTSYPATPLRGLLKTIELPRSVSLFLTSGGHSPASKAFKTGQADLGRAFTATASLGNAVEGTQQEDLIIETFLNDLSVANTSID